MNKPVEIKLNPNHDWPERAILRISRLYTEEETIKGLRQIISKMEIEMGKLRAYVAELEDELKDKEFKHRKQIARLTQEWKTVENKKKMIIKANDILLSRLRIAESKLEIK